MTSILINNLEVCSVTSSLQVLFANPPSSFEVFCPHLVATKTTNDGGNNNNNSNNGRNNDSNNGGKRQGQHEDGKNKQQKISYGSIINITGKRLFLTKGLSQKDCSDFLNTNTNYRHGDNCNFIHAVYLSGFSNEDVKLMEEHIKNNEGYSIKQPTKKVS